MGPIQLEKANTLSGCRVKRLLANHDVTYSTSFVRNYDHNCPQGLAPVFPDFISDALGLTPEASMKYASFLRCYSAGFLSRYTAGFLADTVRIHCGFS
jgi:hypothetical protein